MIKEQAISFIATQHWNLIHGKRSYKWNTMDSNEKIKEIFIIALSELLPSLSLDILNQSVCVETLPTYRKFIDNSLSHKIFSVRVFLDEKIFMDARGVANQSKNSFSPSK